MNKAEANLASLQRKVVGGIFSKYSDFDVDKQERSAYIIVEDTDEMSDARHRRTTMDTFKITASGRHFEQARKLLVKRGGKFDPTSKTWAVESGAIDNETAELFGLQRIAVPSKTLDDIYRDWSDNPNSDY